MHGLTNKVVAARGDAEQHQAIVRHVATEDRDANEGLV